MATFDTTNAAYTVSNGSLTLTKTGGNANWSNERILPIITVPATIDIIIDNLATYCVVGIKRSDMPITGHVGTHLYGYGYIAHSGQKYTNNGGSSYGAEWTTGDKITINFDPVSGDLEFLKNDVSQGVAFTGITGDFYFALCGYYIGYAASITASPSPSIYLQTEQLISILITRQQTQLVSMAPVIYHFATQILAKARQAQLLHEQSMDTTTPIYLQSEQVMQGLVQVALAVTQVMRCYGAPVALEMLQTWASYDNNLVFLPVVQMLGSQLDTDLQELQFSVTVAGQRVGITDCQFDRKGFANFATLMLRKRGDWINKNPGDPVILTVLGEQYQLIVINKPQDEQVGQGSYEVGYVLECASITVQLSEGLNPDIAASRITADFPAGTWLTEILDLLTDGVCTYSLAVPDFMVGAYEFEDVQRYDALREVLPIDYGWIIKTDQAGVLQLSQWARPETGGAGQKTLTMSRKALTPPQDTIYTEVRIYNYNQQDNTSGLILEVDDNGDGTGTIYGYSVPWTEAFALYDSEAATAPSLLFDGGDVEEIDVEDTDVEYVDYAASLSKPCYSDPVVDWGQNDSLSPISCTEAGALSTEIDPGYSVAVAVSYGTRRKVWTYDNKKVDITQIRLKYDATN